MGSNHGSKPKDVVLKSRIASTPQGSKVPRSANNGVRLNNLGSKLEQLRN